MFKINNREYPIEIIKKNNKNTYIRVKDGKIIVTTNYLLNDKMIMKLINDNVNSIEKMLVIDQKKIDKKDNFYYFGKQYDIVYGFSEIDITDNKIYVKDQDFLNKYINKEILKIYTERLDYFYHKFSENIPLPNLKIRNMTSRWGVCNIKNHNITLNRELYKYDIKCLDYVIVHELSHFIYPNHGPDFWKLVSKYFKDYKETRKMLKN